MTRPSIGSAFRWPARGELRWAAAFAAAAMLLTAVPYLYGLHIRPSDAYYSGLLTNPDEHNVYLAYMKEVQEGRFFLIDPFTSEPQQGRVLNLFFLALGLVARFTRLGLPFVYQIARLIAGWLLLMAIYCLGAQAFSHIRARRLALVLAAFASGLGWLFRPQPGQPHPIDYGPGLIMPEAITFLSLLLNPLFCFSMFLMVVIVGFGAHAFCSGSLRSAVITGVAGLVLGNIHTYDVLPVAATLAVFLPYLWIRRIASLRALGLAAVAAGIALPSLAYQVWLVRSGEVTLAIKVAETPVHSPPVLMLAMGIGLPLAFAVLGVARAARRAAPPAAVLLAVWLVIGLAAPYLPVPFQRKLAQGLHIPAVLLTAFAMQPLLAAAKSRAPRGLAAFVVLLTLPSSVLFVARAVADLQTNNRAYLANFMPPLYLRADQYAALKWLDRHADYDDVLLCSSFIGSYAPSLAGTRVYLGHWAETLDFREKLRYYAAFRSADTGEDLREAFVRLEGISYVLRDRSIYDEIYNLSPEGRPLPAFDPERTGWLALVHDADRVSVYRVD